MFSIICPLCQTLLLQEPKIWRCDNGHCFDVAREGYVNLLPVQQKKSREPGDAAEMVKARRDFLEAGHYEPLRAVVCQILAPLKAGSLLDIGCGEGYYTGAMSAVAEDVAGLDIAKPAVQLAAKQWRSLTWLVGSGAKLPLADTSVEVVTSLFSPVPVSEMARVLRDKGHVLVVTPAPEHLRILREALFEVLVPHQPDKFLAPLGEAFELVSREEVRFPLRLTQAALKQLLLMTPYVWRAKAEKRAALEALDHLDTTAEFTLFLLRKREVIQ